MNKITFCVLSKNEEKNIERCLNSVRNFADEIIVVDEHSTDKTVEIAKRFDAVVINNRNSENFAEARNLGIKEAKNDWIFFVDADEILHGRIHEFVVFLSDNPSRFNCVKIKRRDFMWGKEIKHGENGSWNQIRLVKKWSGRWVGKVHERFEPKGGNDNSRVVATTKILLNHYPHQTIAEFFNDTNAYSDLRARELFEQGTKGSIWEIALYPLGKFITDYFLLLGFLDGTRGFIIAAMMSFYSFLTRAKLYILFRHSDKSTS